LLPLLFGGLFVSIASIEKRLPLEVFAVESDGCIDVISRGDKEVHVGISYDGPSQSFG
jgi:hypothetical protein